MKFPSQGTPFVGQSLKQEPAKHEQVFLTNRQRRTVTQ